MMCWDCPKCGTLCAAGHLCLDCKHVELVGNTLAGSSGAADEGREVLRRMGKGIESTRREGY